MCEVLHVHTCNAKFTKDIVPIAFELNPLFGPSYKASHDKGRRVIGRAAGVGVKGKHGYKASSPASQEYRRAGPPFLASITNRGCPTLCAFQRVGDHNCVQPSQTGEHPISNLSWCLADYDGRTTPDIFTSSPV